MAMTDEQKAANAARLKAGRDRANAEKAAAKAAEAVAVAPTPQIAPAPHAVVKNDRFAGYAEVTENLRWTKSANEPTYIREEVFSFFGDTSYANNLSLRTYSALKRCLGDAIGSDGFANLSKLPTFSPGVKVRVVFEVIPE